MKTTFAEHPDDRLRDIENIIGTGDLSLERATELKRDIQGEERARSLPPGGLEAMMKADQKRVREQYFAQFSPLKQIIARAEAIVGRGPEYKYDKHLTEMKVLSNQLHDYAKKLREVREETLADSTNLRVKLFNERKLFALNTHLYTGKQRQLFELSDEILKLEDDSPLANICTTKILELETKRFELESDLETLDSEQNELAIHIESGDHMRRTREVVAKKLMTAYRTVEAQKNGLEAHYQTAFAAMQARSAVKGINRQSLMYAAVLVEKLQGMQKNLGSEDTLDIPAEFRMRIEHKDPGSPGTPYWRTVAAEILKPRYHGPRSDK